MGAVVLPRVMSDLLELAVNETEKATPEGPMKGKARLADLGRVIGNEAAARDTLSRLGISVVDGGFDRSDFIFALEAAAKELRTRSMRRLKHPQLVVLDAAVERFGLRIVEYDARKSFTVQLVAQDEPVCIMGGVNVQSVVIHKNPVSARVYTTVCRNNGLVSFTPRGFWRNRCPPIVFFTFPAEHGVWCVLRDDLREIDKSLRSTDQKQHDLAVESGFSLGGEKQDILRMRITRASEPGLRLGQRIMKMTPEEGKGGER